MADAKPRKARRVALGTAALALVWLFGVWPPPLWWRDHRPRATAMMREAEGWQAGSSSNLPAVHPTALRDISPVLQRMVIIAEVFFQAEDGIRDYKVTRVQTCALP